MLSKKLTKHILMSEMKIAVLAGDGIGPEVVNESIKVLNAVSEVYGCKFQFQEAIVGAEAIFQTGNPLPDATLDICKTQMQYCLERLVIPILITTRKLKYVRSRDC